MFQRRHRSFAPIFLLQMLRGVLFKCLASLRLLLLLYVHSFIVWLYYSTRVLFYFVLSLLSREEKGKFFSEVLRCSRLSRQKNFDASIIRSQFWINHFSTFLSFLSLSLACDYTPPQKVREIERIKTHTHTHTHTDREREREG